MLRLISPLKPQVRYRLVGIRRHLPSRHHLPTILRGRADHHRFALKHWARDVVPHLRALALGQRGCLCGRALTLVESGV